MAPKNKFTKQQLIDTAFTIAKDEGFTNITIRRVAECLGSSIAPIYGNFKDVEELKIEVIQQVNGIYHQMIDNQQSGNSFLDIGIASTLFAKQYPLLFEDIILKSDSSVQWFEEANVFNLKRMKQELSLSKFNELQLNELLLKMQAFQIGLSVLAGKKSYVEILTDEKIIELLKDMYRVVEMDLKKQ